MIVLPLFLSLILCEFGTSATPTFLFESKCITSAGNYTQNSPYHSNLYNLLANLTSQSLATGFYNSTVGQNSDQVYGLYLCRGDVDGEACSSCVDNAKDTLLQKCPNQNGALIWYDECMVRYSNQRFFGELGTTPSYVRWDSHNITGDQAGISEAFGINMNHLIEEVATDPTGKMFATRVVSDPTLYAMGQCTRDLSPTLCDWCLGVAVRQFPVELPTGGRVFQPSCIVRYDTHPFFITSTTSTGNSRQRKNRLLPLSLSISVPSFVGAIVLVLGIYTCLQRRKAMHKSDVEMEEIGTVESLQFDLNTLRLATRNFSLDNKLGEGGFGEVYKGKLENGQEVAVKRLSKNSGQGIPEFKTEVVLVSKLQHKNLVKLLGFCLASKEKILVYEFLPNSSLDRFLWDPAKRTLLDWKTRFKIILGIARGLLYLHEDSRMKVIHRDLKSSNILLDKSMNAKISDFGLAKLFEVDQSQGNTNRIVGTYGYMAPEYAITGHFSDKSDVFSFGVIVLEIASGQKNKYFGRPQAEEALLHRAWRLWNEEKVFDLVDPSLDNKPRDELTKCIHVGLLCIQEDPIRRPRMTTIVAALNGESISLPMPTPPQFFGNTSATTKTSPKNMNSQALGDEIEQVKTSDVYTGTVSITDLCAR